MVRLRVKKSPSATPTSIPASPAESSTRKGLSTLHRGNVKALAALTFIPAPSVGSPPPNKRHPPHSGEQRATHTPRLGHDATGQEPTPRRPTDSAWEAAYSTARMLVGITKESSDMFLPLKAVVGALSVLIKNYDCESHPSHSKAIVLMFCVPANREQCNADGRDRGEGDVPLEYTPFSSRRG